MKKHGTKNIHLMNLWDAIQAKKYPSTKTFSCNSFRFNKLYRKSDWIDEIIDRGLTR